MAKLIELTEIGDADGWGGDVGGGGSACRARNHAPASRLLGPCLPPILELAQRSGVARGFSGNDGAEKPPALSVVSGCQSRKNHVKFYNE